LQRFYRGRGQIDESQKLLAEFMAGKKPITNMLEHVRARVHAALKHLYSWQHKAVHSLNTFISLSVAIQH
jgi:hypothetical protein